MLSESGKIYFQPYLVLASLVFCVIACEDEPGNGTGTSTINVTGGGPGATSGGTAGAGGATAGAGTAGMGTSAGAGGTTGTVVSTFGGGAMGAPGAGTAGPGGTDGAATGGGTGATTGTAGGSGAPGRTGGAGSDAGTGTPGGTGAPDGGTGTGGDAAAGTCPHVSLKGTDICTIGDSWIQIPGNQVTTLENHMKMAGVIAQGDRFDRREVSGSTLSAIIGTYNRKPQNCMVLIMDGGGIDLFVVPAGDQASVAPVVEMFKDFLQKLETDGYVQHVIYSLYPVIPSTPNLNVNMKPGFSEACAASPVDCHLVDLEPLFKGQHIGWDQTHADEAGGVIIGDAWWKAMRENCIAQ